MQEAYCPHREFLSWLGVPPQALSCPGVPSSPGKDLGPEVGVLPPPRKDLGPETRGNPLPLLTNTYKNITYPHPSDAGGKNYRKIPGWQSHRLILPFLE